MSTRTVQIKEKAHSHNEDVSASTIFRANAVESIRATTGAPIKQLGISGWLLTSFFVLILSSSLVFLATTQYTRRETVNGQIIPAEGSFRMVPQLSGTATKIFVREGQFVQTGDPVAVVAGNQTLRNGQPLEDTLNNIQIAQQHAQEQQSVAHLTQIAQQIEELAARRKGLEHDLGQLDDLKALLIRRLGLQKETVAANSALADKGMVSAVALRQQEDALLSFQQQFQQADRDYAQQQAQLAQVLPQLRRLSAEADQAHSEAISAKESLKEKGLNSSAHLSEKLLAPITGFVTALKTREGVLVTPQDTLAVIVPASGPQQRVSLEVELWAPSRAIGFLKAGDHVRLMYDSFPYETFGVGNGTVIEVSGTPIQPREIPSSIEAKESLFRVRVGLQKTTLTAFSQEWRLTPGMLLNADLILEHRTLLQLLFEPLRAANKRFLN